MHIPQRPEKSYWEGEWLFPPTGSNVTISLPGTLGGPNDDARAFYSALPRSFDRIIEAVRPALDSVFRERIGRPLSANMWQDVKLAGFGVENPGGVPTTWDVGFETTGEKWFGVTIPFVGDRPQEAIVDT
jgi:hypothetical protein